MQIFPIRLILDQTEGKDGIMAILAGQCSDTQQREMTVDRLGQPDPRRNKNSCVGVSDMSRSGGCRCVRYGDLNGERTLPT